jgi:hypothetical protein
MVGKIDARPLEKNGEANISAPLNTYNNQVRPCGIPRMKRIAMAARTRSLTIMIRFRSMRSRSTPAMGPASTAQIAREINMPATTRPEPVFARASANTATLL